MRNDTETSGGAESSSRPEGGELAEIDRIFEAQRRAFQKTPFMPADQRISHLQRLKSALVDQQEAFVTAVYADFNGRAEDETLLAEFFPALEGIRYASRRVKRWMRPNRRAVNLTSMPGRAKVLYQPLGVVGIIVPWNYPIYLAVGPLTYALAAGNRVMIKMSEFTPNTATLFQEMIRRTFKEDHVAVVTLELGGKSPAIIGTTTPSMDAAERIAFGKLLNAGQTCIAPDYVLCPRQRADAFVSDLKTCVPKMFPDMKANPRFTAIVNDRQYKRIHGLLEDAKQKGAQITEINPAGEDYTDTQQIPPYVLQMTTEEKSVTFACFFPCSPMIPLTKGMPITKPLPSPLASTILATTGARSSMSLRIR